MNSSGAWIVLMANLNVYVTTSDYYNHLIPGFAYLFNKYWSSNQDATFLCYTIPSYSLPDNFSMVSLGPPERFGNNVREWTKGRRGVSGESYPTPKWTDSLTPIFQRMTDEHFILMQIDYFINRPVELDKIEFLRGFLSSREVAKIDLTQNLTRYSHKVYPTDRDFQIVIGDQQAEYRSSLQAAIWQRDYFLRLLKPNRSPWDFERIGKEELKNDGKLILGLRQPNLGPVSYANLYARGNLDWAQMNRIEESVQKEMFEMGLMRRDWNGWNW
jgi:hypothetical protein